MHVCCSHDWIAWTSREVFGRPDDQLEAKLAETLESYAGPNDFAIRAVSARHYLRSVCFERGMQLTRAAVPKLFKLGLFEEASRLCDEIPEDFLITSLESDTAFMESTLESYMRTGRYERVNQICETINKHINLNFIDNIYLDLISLCSLCCQVKYSKAVLLELKLYIRTIPIHALVYS